LGSLEFDFFGSIGSFQYTAFIDIRNHHEKIEAKLQWLRLK
jgi:hypothetical protein